MGQGGGTFLTHPRCVAPGFKQIQQTHKPSKNGSYARKIW